MRFAVFHSLKTGMVAGPRLKKCMTPPVPPVPRLVVAGDKFEDIRYLILSVDN